MKINQAIASLQSSSRNISLNNWSKPNKDQQLKTINNVSISPGFQKQSFSQRDQTQQFLRQTKDKLNFSKSNLLDFQRKKKVLVGSKKELQFSHINRQIKSSKENLRNRNHKIVASQIDKPIEQTLDFQQKLIILKGILTEQAMASFQNQLQIKLSFIKRKYDHNKVLQQKIKNYYISYEILSRFLDQVSVNTSKIVVREQNIEQYYTMKKQMIGLLANQSYFQKHLEQITKRQQARQAMLMKKNHLICQGSIKMPNKGKYSNSADKSMAQKIEDLLQLSKNNIKQAFINFGKPHLTYEIELQFNKRFNPINRHIFS